MQDIDLSQANLVELITKVYRYGWLAAFFTGLFRFYHQVFDASFFIPFTVLAFCSITATFIPIKHTHSITKLPYCLLIPMTMAMVSVGLQYYFENPGMYIYNLGVTSFLLLSSIWFASKLIYAVLICALTVLHVSGLSTLDQPLPSHIIILLGASFIPVVFFMHIVHNLVIDYRELLAKQTAANQEQDLFLSSVSHELRNPLNGILGSLKLLERDENQSNHFIETATFSANQLHAIVEDLLASQMLINGRMALDESWVDLRDWQRDVDNILLTIAFKPTIDVDSVLDIEFDSSDQQQLFFDKRRVNQIINNLLVNANRYTEAGSVELSIYIQPDMLHVSVIDTGIGIREDTQKIIFDRFVRASDADAYSSQGLGLGLFICQQFVQMMDGSIEVQSIEGAGSSFHVSIPIQTRQKPIEEAQLTVTSDSSETKIDCATLVIDDCPFNRMILKELIGSTVTEFMVAEDGEKALSLIDAHDFDLILSDINMPVMNGFEFIKKLRAQGNQCTCYALSGNVTEEDQKRQSEAGFDGSLTKPIDFELLNKIVTDISLKKLREASTPEY